MDLFERFSAAAPMSSCSSCSIAPAAISKTLIASIVFTAIFLLFSIALDSMGSKPEGIFCKWLYIIVPHSTMLCNFDKKKSELKTFKIMCYGDNMDRLKWNNNQMRYCIWLIQINLSITGRRVCDGWIKQDKLQKQTKLNIFPLETDQ